MAYSVVIAKTAKKEIANLDSNTQERIFNALSDLQETPRPQHSKKLKGDLGYRVRVGDYRILYTIEDSVKIVGVYKVGHRRDVYR